MEKDILDHLRRQNSLIGGKNCLMNCS